MSVFRRFYCVLYSALFACCVYFEPTVAYGYDTLPLAVWVDYKCDENSEILEDSGNQTNCETDNYCCESASWDYDIISLVKLFHRRFQ